MTSMTSMTWNQNGSGIYEAGLKMQGRPWHGIHGLHHSSLSLASVENSDKCGEAYLCHTLRSAACMLRSFAAEMDCSSSGSCGAERVASAGVD